MEKTRALKNVFISIISRIAVLITGLLATRFLIKFLGVDANGLNALFTSIIGVLAVAELGVGTAITFCMYKPICDNDEETVVGLYRLFKNLYLIIGIIILVVGLLLLPALPYLAKDYNLDYNIYICFILMLFSSVITYFFSAKISLINAYKNNYITSLLNSFALVLQSVLQCVFLYCFKSLYLFFLARIIAVLLQWLFTYIITDSLHHNIIKSSSYKPLNSETKQLVVKNIKALFMHKIGTLLVNTVDSIVISAFISVTILGKYNNYVTIITAMTGVISLFITPLTSIIGSLFVKDIKKTEKYLYVFHTTMFIIGCTFFLGYYAICNQLITILFDVGLELSSQIVLVITINYFIQFMRQTVVTFKDATGVFYSDRFRPLVEGLINVVLSILLVKYIDITGVIISTIFTNLVICHIFEPYVLFKDAFKDKPTKYYIMNYSYIVIFVVILFALHFSLSRFEIANNWLSLLIDGSIAVLYALVIGGLIFLFNKDFRAKVLNFFKKKN